MQKSILNLVIIMIITCSITSCGKSSISKMSNKWNVTSYTKTYLDKNNEGTKEAGTATTLIYTGLSGGTVTYTMSGTYNENSFTINKDGSWNSTKDYTYTYTDINNDNATTHVILKESGTWAFVGTNKKEDFKKNERVIFYTLSSQEEDNTITNSTTDYSSSTETYKAGEFSITYTIKESTAKKLVLSSAEFVNSYSSFGNYDSSNTNNSEMTLEQK